MKNVRSRFLLENVATLWVQQPPFRERDWKRNFCQLGSDLNQLSRRSLNTKPIFGPEPRSMLLYTGPQRPRSFNAVLVLDSADDPGLRPFPIRVVFQGFITFKEGRLRPNAAVTENCGMTQ